VVREERTTMDLNSWNLEDGPAESGKRRTQRSCESGRAFAEEDNRTSVFRDAGI
jgi:hypothetical protein